MHEVGIIVVLGDGTGLSSDPTFCMIHKPYESYYTHG